MLETERSRLVDVQNMLETERSRLVDVQIMLKKKDERVKQLEVQVEEYKKIEELRVSSSHGSEYIKYPRNAEVPLRSG